MFGTSCLLTTTGLLVVFDGYLSNILTFRAYFYLYSQTSWCLEMSYLLIKSV